MEEGSQEISGGGFEDQDHFEYAQRSEEEEVSGVSRPEGGLSKERVECILSPPKNIKKKGK